MSEIVEGPKYTTIRIAQSTRDLLLKAGTKEETYDELILRLLREQKLKENGKE